MMKTSGMILFLVVMTSRVDVLAQETPAPQPSEESDLLLLGGTMQIGGSLAFRFDYLYENGWETSWSVNLSPEIGYFVADNWEMVLDLGFTRSSIQHDLYTKLVTIEESDLLAEDQPLLDFSLGAKYLFDLGRAVPYLGLLAGASFILNTGEYSDQTYIFLDFRIPMGVLFPLNRHVALDLGLRLRTGIGVHHGEGVMIDFPVYLGVQTFFSASSQEAQAEPRAAAQPRRGELKLSQGTTAIGGALCSSLLFILGDTGGWGGLRLSVSPELGYFIVDDLALAAEIGVAMPTSSEAQNWIFDFGAGPKYFFDLGRMVPYAGLLLGMSVFTNRGDSGRDWYFFDVKVPVGILVPLNSHVALDVGARIRFSIGDSRHEIAPTGYAGVQAFF